MTRAVRIADDLAALMRVIKGATKAQRVLIAAVMAKALRECSDIMQDQITEQPVPPPGSD